jgi:tetratricopeptide (TPR) repeat protein
VAIAFGLLELTDIISGHMNLPGWSLTAVIMVSVLGFPVAVILSWLFMATPDGIRRYPKNGQSLSEEKEDVLSIEDIRFSGYSYVDGRIVFESDEPEFTPSGKPAKQVGRIYGLSSLSIIGLVLVFFLFYGGKSAPFQERDWVVLADFVNHTGEEIFDQSLNTAFRSRIQEALKRIGLEAHTPLSEELCREIAQREGAKVYIVPEISRVGHQYILTGSLQETESGRVVASEIVYCDNMDGIIAQLDRISKRMRRHLGESRYKISGQSKPLAKVTTSSMDALKQFSLGIESHSRMDFERAVTYYRNAIGMDSTFTAAKASLGNILFERFDQEEGKIWLDEAILSLDDLTEREKNGILAFYAANIENDLDQAIRYIKLNIELYPDDLASRNNLGWYLQNQGHYREAVQHYKKAIGIDPHTMLPYGGLIWIFNEFTGEADSVIFWAKRMLEYAPDNGWSYFSLGSGYFPMGDTGLAEAAFERCAELIPGLAINQFRLANTKRVLGKYEEALDALEDILKYNPTLSNATYQMGINYQLWGKIEEAESHYRHYLNITEQWLSSHPEDLESIYFIALAQTRLGEVEKGMQTGEKAFRMDTSRHINYAMLLAVQEDANRALYQVELALENGYRDYCWIKMNPDLAALQEEERFKELLGQYFN